MNLILLPGNDAKNREWIDGVADAVKDKYDRRIVQYYDHWENGGSFNFEAELQKLIVNVGKLREGTGYAVFGKSAGVVLALGAIDRSAIAPKKCIFVGSA